MTAPHQPLWSPPARTSRFSRHRAVSVEIGRGRAAFDTAAHRLLRWNVKTSSGFTVSTTEPVHAGQRLTVTAVLGPFRIHEPIAVADVVETPDRVGFSYRALPGHPVSGEEAFIVHLEGERVVFTVRSITAPAPTALWRAAYPGLLIAQSAVHRRYLRALQ